MTRLSQTDIAYEAGRSAVLKEQSEREAGDRQIASLQKFGRALPDPLTSVVVLESFMVEGRAAEVGEVVKVPKSTAHSLVLLGRAKYLTD